MRTSHATLEAQSNKFDEKIAKWVFKAANSTQDYQDIKGHDAEKDEDSLEKK